MRWVHTEHKHIPNVAIFVWLLTMQGFYMNVQEIYYWGGHLGYCLATILSRLVYKLLSYI